MLYDEKYKEAIHYYDISRYEQCIKVLHELLSSYPNDSHGLLLIAHCYYNLDRYDEAIEYCKQSAIGNLLVEEVAFLLGKIHMEKKKFAESERNFLEVLRVNPSNPSALSFYGLLMFKTDNEKKAKKLIDEAMRIDPNNPDVLHVNLVFFMYKNKKHHQITALEKYLDSASSDFSKVIHIGIYNLHNKNYTQARENFRQAFLMNPTDTEILGILRELERRCSIFFIPIRFIGTVSPAILWIGFIVCVFIFTKLELDFIATAILILYLSLAVYSWGYVITFKIIDKIRDKKLKPGV